MMIGIYIYLLYCLLIEQRSMLQLDIHHFNLYMDDKLYSLLKLYYLLNPTKKQNITCMIVYCIEHSSLSTSYQNCKIMQEKRLMSHNRNRKSILMSRFILKHSK